MLRPPIALLFAVLVIVIATSFAPAQDTSHFRVATFQSDVTLPLGNLLYAKPLTTIEHPLLAKGIVIDTGDQRYVLCAVDWCTMRNATHAVFRHKLAAAVQTDIRNTAVQCVHQHTAPPHDASVQHLLDEQENPPAYRSLQALEDITDRLAEAVKG